MEHGRALHSVSVLSFVVSKSRGGAACHMDGCPRKRGQGVTTLAVNTIARCFRVSTKNGSEIGVEHKQNKLMFHPASPRLLDRLRPGEASLHRLLPPFRQQTPQRSGEERPLGKAHGSLCHLRGTWVLETLSLTSSGFVMSFLTSRRSAVGVYLYAWIHAVLL